MAAPGTLKASRLVGGLRAIATRGRCAKRPVPPGCVSSRGRIEGVAERMLVSCLQARAVRRAARHVTTLLFGLPLPVSVRHPSAACLPRRSTGARRRVSLRSAGETWDEWARAIKSASPAADASTGTTRGRRSERTTWPGTRRETARRRKEFADHQTLRAARQLARGGPRRPRRTDGGPIAGE